MRHKSDFVKFLYDSMRTLASLRMNIFNGLHPDDYGRYSGRVEELENTTQSMCELLELDVNISCEEVWKLYVEISDNEEQRLKVPAAMSQLNIC